MVKATINITLRKDGRFMGKLVTGCDENGKAQFQYVYGKTYDEAEQKVMIGQEVASRYISNRYITVGKAYEEWLNAVKNRVKESTLANYMNKFEKHILPTLGNVPCADLTAGRINAFINKKLADGLSASYVRDIFTVFKSMLKYAKEEYGFNLSLKNVVLPKAEQKQIEKISNFQQKKLIAYLTNNMTLTLFRIVKPHRFTAPVYFAYNTGLVRDVIGEVVLFNILGVIVTELGVSDRNTFHHTVLILLPQQLERNAGLLQFHMDMLIVDGSVYRLFVEFIREKEQINLIVTLCCQIRIADTQFSCTAAYSRNRLGGDVPRFFNLPLRHWGLEKLKNEFHIDFVRHIHGLLRVYLRLRL